MSERRLVQTPFYRDPQFAVALWDGDVGAVLKVMVDKPTPRSAFACLTVCLRGQLLMISPSGAEKWRFFPGSISDEGGDFDEVGVWTWTAVRGNTQELCFSALGEDGKECDDPFPREVIDMQFGQKLTIKGGCLMVVATGGVVANISGDRDLQLLAPHFSKVENDVELTANYSDTRLVVVRRK
jgi:hypothetical protein